MVMASLDAVVNSAQLSSVLRRLTSGTGDLPVIVDRFGRWRDRKRSCNIPLIPGYVRHGTQPKLSGSRQPFWGDGIRGTPGHSCAETLQLRHYAERLGGSVFTSESE